MVAVNGRPDISIHLQGADDPKPVAGQDRGRRGRVEPGQPGVQRGRADPAELLLQLRADSLASVPGKSRSSSAART